MTAPNPLAGVIATATELPIAQVRRDGGTQPRAVIDQSAVAAYAEDMRDGRWRWDRDLPVVFYDGQTYWLADGFHRFAAAEAAGLEAVPCDVRQGDRRAAVLYSVGANANHGLRRSNEDKRRAVATLLADAEWCQWSDREIARRCSVSYELVSNMRPSLSESDSENRIYTTKQGTTAVMNTANIGAHPSSGPNPAAVEAVRTWLLKHVSAGQRTYALRNYRAVPWSNTLRQHTAGLAPEQVRAAVSFFVNNPDEIATPAPGPAAEPAPAPVRTPPPAPVAPIRSTNGTSRTYTPRDEDMPRPATGPRFVTLDETEIDSLANVVEGQAVDAVSIDDTGRLLIALRNGFVIHLAAVTQDGRPALAWRIAQ